MFALTLKELLARKRRMLSTIFAVLLGVSLTAGTLVLTDTMLAAGDSALEDARAGIDAMVRAPSEVDLAYGQVGTRMDAGTIDAVRRVPGVEHAALQITGYAQLVDADGRAVGDQEQGPTFGQNWIDVPALNPFRLAEGEAPRADDEIVIDRGSADAGGFHVGDRVTVLTQLAPAQFTIAGVATFGSADSPAGATAVLFTDTAAQRHLSAPGQVDGVAVEAADGVAHQDLVDRLAAVAPGLDVVSGATLVAEDQAAFHGELGELRVFLMVFAFVAVFVGAFMINNTFSITVAQRSQQLAVLRALGASRRQVLRSVMTEAFTIGVVGAGAGLVVGLGLAAGLRALFGALGQALPEGPLVVDPASMVISAGVGILLTVVSAWMPARRAGKVPPIAALRQSALDRSGTSKRRAVIGTFVTAAGCGALLVGLGNGTIELVGLGAFVALAGVAVSGPVIARPLVRAFGVVVARRGATGELAVRNAHRNPTRTARSASSLMIGVALVAFTVVLASSVKASFRSSLEDTFTGTHIVDSGAYEGRGGFSPELADLLGKADGVSVTSESRVAPATVGGSETHLSGFTGATIGRVFDLGDVAGDLGALGVDGLAVDAAHAAERGWEIGTPVDVTFATGTQRFVVRAIFADASEWVGSTFVDVAAFDRYLPGQLDFRVYAIGDDSTIRSLAAGYPSASVQDEAEFMDGVNAELDMVVGVIYGLLGLAVLIALLGIANTLALSTHERTRELGLLRAVGTSRSQVRSIVRWESIMIALFGTALGLGIGTFFGWATVRALGDEGVDHFTIPVVSLAVVTVIAGLAGAVAAIGPARRAARIDVLQALATT